MEKTSPFRYDVAISFAGPDRALAEELARYLASWGVRVFYDRYEEAALWGKTYTTTCRTSTSDSLNTV